MRVQAWSRSAVGQNLPLENLVWWVSGCRKCLGSWGCIVDYKVEELQSAAWPAAESLQVCGTPQLRPIWEPLISDITGTQDRPEKWIRHTHTHTKQILKSFFLFLLICKTFLKMHGAGVVIGLVTLIPVVSLLQIVFFYNTFLSLSINRKTILKWFY